jgi:hypothetical protein
LNTAYPEWDNQQINIHALSLKSFASGAKIYVNGKVKTLADPFREGPIALQALFSGSISVKDMLLLLKLRNHLKSQSHEQIFSTGSSTTLQFLQDFGFSRTFIERFFRPFYAGIFLESELITPASMFSFVFKAFSEGTASLPDKGMHQLIKLISSELNDDNIRTSAKVVKVQTASLTLADGTELAAPRIWVTTGTSGFQGLHRKEWKNNHSTSVLYFSSDNAPAWGKFIGLNAVNNGLVNHFCMPSAVQSAYSPEGKHLLSISLRPGITYKEGMEVQVQQELEMLKAIHHPIAFLKAVTVDHALPNLNSMQYKPELIPLHEGVFATGDFAAYPSVNAALHAGRLLLETL